jgi:hypothetical protein
MTLFQKENTRPAAPESEEMGADGEFEFNTKIGFQPTLSSR